MLHFVRAPCTNTNKIVHLLLTSPLFSAARQKRGKKRFKNYLKVQNIFHNGLIFWKSFCIITEYKDTLGSKRANRPVSELGERVKLS